MINSSVEQHRSELRNLMVSTNSPCKEQEDAAMKNHVVLLDYIEHLERLNSKVWFSIFVQTVLPTTYLTGLGATNAILG